jgi:hypothetical protein
MRVSFEHSAFSYWFVAIKGLRGAEPFGFVQGRLWGTQTVEGVRADKQA